MKKKLEADLISIAHRILQLKNRDNISVLQEEARKLYEKLSVLKFIEEHFESGSPTIGKEKASEILEKGFDYDGKVIVGSLPAEDEDEKSNETNTPLDLAEEKNNSEETSQVKLKENKAEGLEEVESDEPKSDENNENTSVEATDESEEEKIEAVKSEENSAGEEKSEEEKSEEESTTFTTAENFVQPEAKEEIAAVHENETQENPVPAETSFEITPDQDTKEAFESAFSLDFEPAEKDNKYDAPAPEFTFDDLLGKDYADPVFITREELEAQQKQDLVIPEMAPEKLKEPEPVPTDIWSRRPFDTPEFEKPATSLNEKLSKGITIGLNDRIAFMKNLFNNSSEDYNRVLSQLMTIDNFAEARKFVQEMIKPDYNNWEGKEEYEQRFMEIVEKRFM